MGFYLLPVIVLIFFCSLIQIEQNHAQQAVPPSVAINAVQTGQEFVAYRNAVMAFNQQNPGYTGIVPLSSLTAMGAQFPPGFQASNIIVSTDAGTGRAVICYAALPAGSLAAALNTTGNDASFGLAAGNSWISSTTGATAVAWPQGVSVPNGDVVSFYQTGN
jgi:hypothetical protein